MKTARCVTRALVVASLDFDLELEFFLKSVLGWVKGWGLMAAFVFAGAFFAAVRFARLATGGFVPVAFSSALTEADRASTRSASFWTSFCV